jgi:mannose PTS system EIIA component
MIGIVVVTHGRVASELLSAARTIVGDIPAITAVSIGWTDDMAVAREAIVQAIADVGGGDVLILTDMFGGTPTNVSLPFLSSRVEIVTGVNLPMLIKLSSLRDGNLSDIARIGRDQGRSAIYVASEVLEHKPAPQGRGEQM